MYSRYTEDGLVYPLHRGQACIEATQRAGWYRRYTEGRLV